MSQDEDGLEMLRVVEQPPLEFSGPQDAFHKQLLEQHTRRMMAATMMNGHMVTFPRKVVDNPAGLIQDAVRMADLIIEQTK